MRPKTLADVGMRFPPPPGTRFYVCFRVNEFAAWPPYEEMLTVVANHPQDAIEQVLRDGKVPTDPSLRCVSAVCFNHMVGRAFGVVGLAIRPPNDKRD